MTRIRAGKIGQIQQQENQTVRRRIQGKLSHRTRLGITVINMKGSKGQGGGDRKMLRGKGINPNKVQDISEKIDRGCI